MNVMKAETLEFDWIEQRTGCVLTRNARAIKAVDRTGRTRGMVAYDCWTPNSVQAHIAIDTPIAWRALEDTAFEYPFVQTQRSIMIAIIQASNARSRALVKRCGLWNTHAIKNGWGDGEDLLIYEITRREWETKRAERQQARVKRKLRGKAA